MPRKLTVTARTIFSPPHKAQMVSEGESQGRHLNTIDGPERLPCILDRQRRLPKTLRDHVRSASALSALKKSLVANLSAKRQLSVAKLSAKRIFSLAKRDFLVANGRMAADFSSPDFAGKTVVGGCAAAKDTFVIDLLPATASFVSRRSWPSRDGKCLIKYPWTMLKSAA